MGSGRDADRRDDPEEEAVQPRAQDSEFKEGEHGQEEYEVSQHEEHDVGPDDAIARLVNENVTRPVATQSAAVVEADAEPAAFPGDPELLFLLIHLALRCHELWHQDVVARLDTHRLCPMLDHTSKDRGAGVFTVRKKAGEKTVATMVS